MILTYKLIKPLPGGHAEIAKSTVCIALCFGDLCALGASLWGTCGNTCLDTPGDGKQVLLQRCWGFEWNVGEARGVTVFGVRRLEMPQPAFTLLQESSVSLDNLAAWALGCG